MKTAQKRVLRILIALLIVGLYTSCEPKGKEKPKDGEEHEEPTKIEEPRDIIALDEARTLYKTYEDRRVPLIENYEDAFNKKNRIDKKFDVARYVRFDYKMIKDYIAYIEQEAKNAEIDISSLRIYLANNPVNDSSRVHPRQNSVMLSPTTTQKGEEYLFYIDDSAEESPKAVLLNYDFTRKENSSSKPNEGGDDTNEASVFPNLFRNSSNSTLAPFENLKSTTLNRGNSAPPPPYQ